MSAWQEYKKKLGDTRPWDMFRVDVPRVSDEIAEERMGICNNCPELLKITKQCKQCGCVMPAKTKLLEATCPLGNW